jgi:RecA-family ATPase
VPEQIEWRIDQVIEKDTSGFIIALPKSGKSFATVAMAVALACGGNWLDCRVSEPTRVALVSREDAPGLTARRLKRVMVGMGKAPDDPIWETNLLVNSREQTKSLMLDDDQQLAALIIAMQEKRIEFCILDVLNVLHDADENDNSEMRRVLTRVSQIRKEVGCQICIVHHSVKDWDDTKTLSQLARGSSAIAGFAEFIIGIRMVDEVKQMRQMRFETKSSEPLQPFYWTISDLTMGGVELKQDPDYELATPRKAPARQKAENLFAAS